MIKGLTITPPVLGRISIGRVIVKDGKRLPAKDDQFTITSQVQNKDGWCHISQSLSKHPNPCHNKQLLGLEGVGLVR